MSALIGMKAEWLGPSGNRLSGEIVAVECVGGRMGDVLLSRWRILILMPGGGLVDKSSHEIRAEAR